MPELSDAHIVDNLEKIFTNDQYKSLEDWIGNKYVFPSTKNHTNKNLLFVGINPSYDGTSNYISYSWENNNIAPHFKRYKSVAKEAGFENSWSCIDLFYFRKTKQADIKQLLDTEIGLRFMCDQLILTQSIIEKLKPKIIVVANTAARWYCGIDAKNNTDGIWMGYKFTEGSENEIIGLDEKSINKDLVDKGTNLIGVKVIFSRSLLYMKKEMRTELIQTLQRLNHDPQ